MLVIIEIFVTIFGGVAALILISRLRKKLKEKPLSVAATTSILGALGILAFVVIMVQVSRSPPHIAPTDNVKEAPRPTLTSNLKLFPSDEACNYPSKSSIAKFHSLGGGKWRHMVVGDTDFGYDCGTSEKQLYLISDGNSDAVIEYGVMGPEEGAKMVGFDYDINTNPPIPNEPIFRKEFATLINEVTRQALKQPLPESAKSKILDLSTFASYGVRNEEIFPIGDGQLTLSRNRRADNTAILVRISICPDKNVPCK